ncbi:transposase [Burkholderia multivorans]
MLIPKRLSPDRAAAAGESPCDDRGRRRHAFQRVTFYARATQSVLRAHHWARKLVQMGHQVKLMPGEFVKAFNIRNKNDAADARAIWFAVQQPGKSVAVKTEMQQAMLAVHRAREQLIKFRTCADC